MLTENMKKTLLQIGCGVFPQGNRYYDEDNIPVDLRSAQALFNRGLIFYITSSKGSQLCGKLNLTKTGEDVFEEVQAMRMKSI
jgi:hypothetical protein